VVDLLCSFNSLASQGDGFRTVGWKWWVCAPHPLLANMHYSVTIVHKKEGQQQCLRHEKVVITIFLFVVVADNGSEWLPFEADMVSQ
tara:strand:- start:1785 stop:2045 length:261 start_codon:yes stop_codon:yes gene_type:complete